MIGAKDLEIVGVTKNGERVQIFKDGNWRASETPVCSRQKQ